MLQPGTDLAKLLGHDRVRSLEDGQRQTHAGDLRIVLLVGNHAQQVELADAGDITRRTHGGVEHLAQERQADAQGQAQHDRQRQA